jgi:predicted dehydrogenase
VCSRNPESVAAQARTWKIRGWTDPDAMLRDVEVDVVYISTPIGLHAEHGRRVLQAGKHLWCEKPLATSLDATVELLATAQRKRLSVCEGLMYLYHPHFQQLNAYLTNGRLGTVLSVGSRFGIPKLEYGSFRTDPNLGGGALFDVGCYPISAIHALFPEHETRVAASQVGTRDGSAVDTDGTAMLEVTNGVTAQLEWRIDCAYRNEMTVWGTEGSVTTHQIFSKLATYVPEFEFRDFRGVPTVETGVAADHFATMLERFAAVTAGAIDDSGERARIVRTATVMDEIWRRGGK